MISAFSLSSCPGRTFSSFLVKAENRVFFRMRKGMSFKKSVSKEDLYHISMQFLAS